MTLVRLGKLQAAKFLEIKVDDYSHFFLFYFLRDQNSQHFNEDLLGVNASASGRGGGYLDHFHTGMCRLGAQTQPCLKFFGTQKYYPV